MICEGVALRPIYFIFPVGCFLRMADRVLKRQLVFWNELFAGAVVRKQAPALSKTKDNFSHEIRRELCPCERAGAKFLFSKIKEHVNTNDIIYCCCAWFQQRNKRKNMIEQAIVYARFQGLSQQTMMAIYDIANDALLGLFDGEKILPVANTEYKAASSLLAHIDKQIADMYHSRRNLTRGESRPIVKNTSVGTVTKNAKKTTLKVGKCFISVSTID